MTDERLIRLLENPDLLSSISFEELKTLALAYPYAHNLRYLLAIKASMENNPDAERLMAVASVYSLDRGRLFSLMYPEGQVPEPVPAPESAEQPATEPTVAAPEEEPSGRLLAEEPASNGLTVSFSEWYAGFNLPLLKARPRPAPRKTENKPPEPAGPTFEATLPLFSAQDFARESLREKPHLYSETLVELLVKQGHKDRAIAMLTRMRLDHPEKSAYFAAAIEKLKN